MFPGRSSCLCLFHAPSPCASQPWRMDALLRNRQVHPLEYNMHIYIYTHVCDYVYIKIWLLWLWFDCFEDVYFLLFSHVFLIWYFGSLFVYHWTNRPIWLNDRPCQCAALPTLRGHFSWGLPPWEHLEAWRLNPAVKRCKGTYQFKKWKQPKKPTTSHPACWIGFPLIFH